MPFKWRLKKTRKYDISNKNLFIVGVYLLDRAYLECTLNAESTGQECLNSIAQRIELTESAYFGLRYVTKKMHFHWADLEKPLKKQLDKHAQPSSHSHCLYFGLMFYIIGAHKIPDEVARYHYYLQLKIDVIEGRLPCSVEQAIRLAAYSLQAEFGDYEPDKYTAEEYLLFPKAMMKDESAAADLLSEAIVGHASLQGVPPVRAELQYVKEVQMMDGYGAEYYGAKDESRKDLYLGTSHAGMFARYVDGQSTVYYRWAEIAKITQNKKTLEIDTSKSSVQFQMDDTDTAKYVSRLAQLQRQFYKSSKGNLSPSLSDLSIHEEGEAQSFIDAQQVIIPPTDSSHSSQEFPPPQALMLHTQEQKYSQDILQSSQQSLESSTESQQLQQQYPHHHHQQLHHHHHQQQQQHQQHLIQQGPDGDGGIGGNNIYQQQVMRNESLTPTPEGEPLYMNRVALLPAYRPSPDYDMVMQQRMVHQQHPTHFEEIMPHLGAAQVYVHPDGMAYSQPEISQMTSAYRDEHGNYANVDALRSYGHSVYANIFQDDHNFYTGRGDRGTNLAVHPTYSSPELNTELRQQEGFAASEYSAQEAMAYHFRLPPPYPRTSSSTPDLAGQTEPTSTSGEQLKVSSIQTMAEFRDTSYGPHELIVQSRLDRSVEDLSGFQNFQQMAYSAGGMQVPVAASGEVNNECVLLPRVVDNNESTEWNHGNSHLSEKAVDANGAGVSVTKDTPIGGSTKDSPVQSSLPETELRLVSENINRVLSDDQDDTSSEHSYSTFHAKESDDSSEEEAVRNKLVQPKEESKIQIRMFTPEEAPPPSKIKEEATLRESFRRMKIARVGSLNKEVPGLRQSSLRRLKEETESLPISLRVVSEQPQEAPSNPSVSNVTVKQSAPPLAATNDPEMKEILERLGAPPPYPSTIAVSDTTSVKTTSSSFFSKDSNLASSSSPTLDDAAVAMKGFQSTRQAVGPSKAYPVTVKRSSSVGTTPLRGSPSITLKKDEPPAGKLKSTTYSLDTVVPISRPGMVLFSKDSESGASVLRSESMTKSSTTESDTDSIQCLSEPGSTSSDRGPGLEDHDGSENVTSLQDYSMGSDSDSDLDRGSPDAQLSMGPLKMAAMNGLTLSRSMVLSLMNDDSRAPKDDRRRMLESKISEGQVYSEFEQVPKKSPTMECNVAKSPSNSPRNRFKDVLPYDLTRVKLTPRRDNPEGYINASHIKLTANDTKWLFIATQAPMENTAVDFWQMVWENHVDVLAMLTPFQELGKSKCFIYWPQEPGRDLKQVYGEFEVELQFTDDSLCYLTSRIILRHLPSGQERLVWHLQYTDWPDHGCPEDTYGFLGFLDEIESVSRLAESESGRGEKSPVVVHCSAGVGRTGVVILTMVMKWCLEHNHNVDLPKALLGIRNQRMHMVQTMGQYQFIHDTLIQYLKNTRLI